MATRQYLVVYEPTPNNWGAYAPDIPGLGATAATRAEMEAQIRSAIEFLFEYLADEGQPIPEPHAKPQAGWDWGYVEVEVPDPPRRVRVS